MENIIQIESISQANEQMGIITLHPQVSVIDFSKCPPAHFHKMNIGFYGVFLKEKFDTSMTYGRNKYDYQEGTLVFIAPNQIVGFGSYGEAEVFQPTGWALLFHADLLLGTALGRNIKSYNFFTYDVYEALHVSDIEKQIVLDCFQKIEIELKRGIDKHSKTLIVSNIELFLNYCIRFYDRQFIIREQPNKDLISRFDTFLDEYLQSDKPSIHGFLSVAYCADFLNLSANYFGDLVKRETGKTAQEYIQYKLIEVAKVRIFETNKTATEIAYELGFKYPQHFTRLFKQKVGMSPMEFRGLN